MYSIDGLNPSGGMGGHGFVIHLHLDFHKAVAVSDIQQEHVDRVLKAYGPEWLINTGHTHYYDPGAYHDPWDFDERRRKYKIPSDEARLSEKLSVTWGEWGPEHITVPGNACGLDLDKGTSGCIFDDGVCLVPHNIDSWNQKMLLLLIFTWFAHAVGLDYIVAKNKSKRK
jgi:hypothetical protein